MALRAEQLKGGDRGGVDGGEHVLVGALDRTEKDVLGDDVILKIVPTSVHRPPW